MKVLICSKSSIKKEAVYNIFSKRFPTQDITIDSIDTIDCDELKLPPQPVNCADFCAKARLDFGKLKSDRYDYYVSVENGLDDQHHFDNCSVLVEHRGIITHGEDTVLIPNQYRSLLNDLGTKIKYPNNNNITGYNITFGQKLHENYGFDAKDWMKTTNKYGRVEMISKALSGALDAMDKMLDKVDTVIQSYKEYQDFPKPGVVFQDIFAVLANPTSLQLLSKIMKSRYRYDSIDYVVGLESRGFFGVLLAQKLKVGFVPIRKAGKLPGPTESIEYGTEYSKDVCEIQTDIPKGSKVLIFDDLIATGGSLKASVDLVLKLECVIVDCCVLREVKVLREVAKEKLNRSYTVLLN